MVLFSRVLSLRDTNILAVKQKLKYVYMFILLSLLDTKHAHIHMCEGFK
jgi:hypothetical protein